MDTNKKTKWILHPGVYRDAKIYRPKRGSFFSYPGKVIFGISYAFGLIVWWVCLAVGYLLFTPLWSLWKIGLLSKARFTQTLKLLQTNPSKRFAFLVFASFIILSVGSLRLASLVSHGFAVKGQVLGQAQLGFGSLKDAQNLLTGQDVSLAQGKFAQALNSFQNGQKDLSSTGVLLSGILSLAPQKRDADNLLSGAADISTAGLAMTQFYQQVGTLKLSPQGLTADQNSQQMLSNLSKLIATAQKSLTDAQSKLALVNTNSVPDNYRLEFVQAKSRLNILSDSIEVFGKLFDTMKGLATGQKEVLLLFENNNELRPTGGFLGTYGRMSLNSGSISNLHIASIYDLDGQLIENIAPPHPLLAVNGRWYMRDSNWFANFPDSAKKIISFYEKEGGQTPDYVIALTPQLVEDLLKLTGPIAMDRYGVVLTSDNFVELAQLKTSVDYDKVQNQPKQMLADFFPALLQKVFSLSTTQAPLLLQTLQNNLTSKQILLYSRDSAAQTTFENFGWTGSLKSTDRDFLSIVSSNLGGTKTDLSVTQRTELSTQVALDGTITDTLTLTRTNTLPNQAGLENLSFLRVFVPQGAKLISSQGFSPKELTAPSDTKQKIDPDVYAWEKNSVRDVLTDTLIGQEAGYSFFGNWLEVKGGETKTVTLNYQLPFKLSPADRMSLLLEKQPGSVNETFGYNLDFPGRQIAWKNFSPQTLNDHNLQLESDISSDAFLGEVLNSENQ